MGGAGNILLSHKRFANQKSAKAMGLHFLYFVVVKDAALANEELVFWGKFREAFAVFQ